MPEAGIGTQYVSTEVGRRTLRLFGIIKLYTRNTTTNIKEAAVRVLRWLWIKRSDLWNTWAHHILSEIARRARESELKSIKGQILEYQAQGNSMFVTKTADGRRQTRGIRTHI